jgi:hypothetical protein
MLIQLKNPSLIMAGHDVVAMTHLNFCIASSSLKLTWQFRQDLRLNKVKYINFLTTAIAQRVKH